METNLVLALSPTAETEALLNAVQASLLAEWPLAEAWPSFIPLVHLGSMPAFQALERAKAVPWARMDIAPPWRLTRDGHGNLCVQLDRTSWINYRAEIGTFFAGDMTLADGTPGTALPDFAPHLVLAHGPGSLPASAIQQKTLVLSAPFLSLYRFTEFCPSSGIRQINWELLASHRVCKAR